MNHLAKYLDQRSFSSKVITWTHRHTHSGPIALPRPLVYCNNKQYRHAIMKLIVPWLRSHRRGFLSSQAVDWHCGQRCTYEADGPCGTGCCRTVVLSTLVPHHLRLQVCHTMDLPHPLHQSNCFQSTPPVINRTNARTQRQLQTYLMHGRSAKENACKE